MIQNNPYKNYYKNLFDSIPDYWDSIYNKDTFFGYHYQRRRQQIAELLYMTAPKPDQTVLDVGCGAGGYFPIYLSPGLIVNGIDVSDGMVEKAREVHKEKVEEGRVTVDTGDIEHLKFEDSYFDYAVSAGVFMYLPDMKKALAEMHRVLKNGGYAILNVDNHRNITSAMDIPTLMVNAASKLLKQFRKGSETKPVRKENCSGPVTKSYSPSALRHMAHEQGFEIVNEVGHGFGPVRMFGIALFPEKVNLLLYKLTEPLFNSKQIGRMGFTYTLLVRKS